MVLVIGTSLQVVPMALLPRMCSDAAPRLLINMEKVWSERGGWLHSPVRVAVAIGVTGVPTLLLYCSRLASMTIHASTSMT